MIKKILPISVFVLVLVVILLIGLQSMLSKGKSQQEVSLTPTLIPGSQGGNYTPVNNSSNRMGTTASTTPLTPEELQKKLPIIAPDFTLNYSPRMQRYVVTVGSGEGATNSYNDWIAQNSSYADELQNAIVTKQTLSDLNAALDYAQKNKLSPQDKAVQEAQDLTQNLSTLINLPFLFSQLPQLTPIPTLVPTVVPSPSPFPTEMTQPTPTPNPIVSPTTLISTSPINSLASSLLPSPMSPISSKALAFRQSVESCLANRTIYDTASSQTGIPWEILAAIHYNEGGCADNRSLVSGRIIGTNEPDIVNSGGGCSSAYSGPGIPVPLPSGGCGFYTLLDSALYAGNLFKGKIGKVPSNFTELTAAFSGYSGGGNSNCKNVTPYPYCPRLFKGEDDSYVMNMFDQKHETMYLIYCADGTKCNPPRLHGRPGVTTIIRLLTNQL